MRIDPAAAVDVEEDTALGRDSEARLRAIVEHGPAGQAMTTLDGVIQEANPALCAILGRPADDVVGHLFWSFIHPDDRAGAGAKLGRLFAGDTDRVVDELRALRPDGSTVDVEVAGSLLRRDDGRPHRLIAVLHDVSDRRRIERALRESEERFRLLTANSADLVTRHAPSGQLLWASPASLTLLGYAPGNLVTAGTGPLAEPAKAAVIAQACRVLATGSALETFTLPYSHRNGDTVWLESKAWAVRDADGRTIEIQAVSRDVTGRHRAEQELARRAGQQAAVARLGQFALRVDDPAAILDEACRTAGAALEADTACYLRLEPGGRELLLVAGVGWPDGTVGTARADATAPQPSFILRSGNVVVVSDFDTEDRFRPAPPLLEQGLRSGMTVPVRGSGAPHGLLGIHSREPRRYSDDDTAFLAAVANVVASYLDRHTDQQQARHAGLHDALTGIPNRTMFLDRAGAALGRSARSGRSTAVVLLDLDQFKVINDGLDYQAGDEMLRQVAARLEAALRPGDTVARLGGDEFAVLCEDLGSPDDVLGLAERFRESLTGAFHLQGRVFFTTASIGVATDSGNPAGGAVELLRNAETAMYRAKAAGRARIEAHDPDMQRHAAERFELGAELHDALARGELHLLYQPLVRLRDGEVVGTEALVRWEHPRRGLVGPGEFIPVAEETGVIVPIGAWILDEACAAAARWPAMADGTPRKVSVNVSSRQLADAGLLRTVAGALERSGLAPSALCLEITEGLLMTDVDRSDQVLGTLKALGVRLSIDDFGTGYSSLARLKRFPLDYLKVDRSFVDGLGVDADDDAIVTAMIRLAHSLGMPVVAEGVEDERQLAALRRLHCEAAQGRLWSEAVPEADLLRCLEHLVPFSMAAQPIPERSGLSGDLHPTGAAARVLVVDDDADHLELVRVLLEARGHGVVLLDDPARFIDATVRIRPDLVLMDLRMPGIGGLDLIQDLAATGLHPPVVAVTAHPEWISRPLNGISLFAGVVSKPIDPETFAAQIEAHLAAAGD